jgi:hypothetical protein
MRIVPFLLASALIGGCAAQPVAPVRTAKAQQHLDKLIAGKVAGAPQACLPHRSGGDMVVIDDATIAFRHGSGRTYVNHLQGGGCPNLANNTLITRSFGGTGLCRGEIAHVANVSAGVTLGSCVIGDFVPYTRPRG